VGAKRGSVLRWGMLLLVLVGACQVAVLADGQWICKFTDATDWHFWGKRDACRCEQIGPMPTAPEGDAVLCAACLQREARPDEIRIAIRVAVADEAVPWSSLVDSEKVTDQERQVLDMLSSLAAAILLVQVFDVPGILTTFDEMMQACIPRFNKLLPLVDLDNLGGGDWSLTDWSPGFVARTCFAFLPIPHGVHTVKGGFTLYLEALGNYKNDSGVDYTGHLSFECTWMENP